MSLKEKTPPPSDPISSAAEKVLDPLEKARVRRKDRTALLKDILRIFLIGLFFVAAGWVFKGLDVEWARDELHPDASIAGRLQSYVIFIVLASLLQSVGLFRWFVCMVAGGIYGAFIGVILSMTSSLLGALGTYMIGSSLLRGVVRRRLKARRIERWKGLLNDNPFFGTLYMRMFPASNAVLTGLLCGTVRIRLRPYFAANFIGFLPQTVIFCLLGSGAVKARPNQLAMGIALFFVVLLAQWLTMNKMKKRREFKAFQKAAQENSEF